MGRFALVLTVLLLVAEGCVISPRRTVGSGSSSSGGNSELSWSATPPSQTVTAGALATYTVSVQALNGFKGTVTLSASASNSNVVATFDNTTITGGSGTAVLTVQTTSTTPSGNVTVTITATDTANSVSQTATATAVVQGGTSTAAALVPAQMTATTAAALVPVQMTATTAAALVPVQMTATTAAAVVPAQATASTATTTAPAGCVRVPAGSGIQRVSFAATPGSQGFTATFDVTPSDPAEDAVLGAFSPASGGQPALNTLITFSPSGVIQASDGDTLAPSSVPYSGGETYHFRLTGNLPAATYSVFVTPPGATEISLGTNLQVPSDQRGATTFNGLGLLAKGPEGATLAVCQFSVQ
jgi:hypothetical protein